MCYSGRHGLFPLHNPLSMPGCSPETVCSTDKEKALCGEMVEICVRGRHMALHNLESSVKMTLDLCEKRNPDKQACASSVTYSAVNEPEPVSLVRGQNKQCRTASSNLLPIVNGL